ncbi:hypothetical protein PBI_SCTP2_226 [Salicola phage SCTP-2]|nr:hypothetical protein PBI_SCTP2_226 [Salicola phage SCTP-2]
MSTSLDEYFQNSDESTREQILENIIFENHGYSNHDLTKISLNNYYIKKIIDGDINNNTRASIFGIISLMFALGESLCDETWKMVFEKKPRCLMVYPQARSKPLKDDIIEYGLRKYYEHGEKVLNSFPDSHCIKEIFEIQKSVNDEFYKIIIDNEPDLIPFLEDLPQSIIDYFVNLMNDNGYGYDFSNINDYSEDVLCEIIEAFPFAYILISNPSDEINKIMIDHNIFYIKILRNQTDNFYSYVLDKEIRRVDIFKSFVNPSKEVQYKAIGMNPSSISHVSDPDEHSQQLAIEYNPENIVYIDAPYEHILLKALKTEWNVSVYEIVCNNIQNYSDEFRHYFNKLKLERGIPVG